MSDASLQGEMVLKLAEEFLNRWRMGERPPLSEYTERHPELAAEINDVFPTMAMMENIAIGDEAPRTAACVDAATPAQPVLERLDDFRIIRQVGRGGMGVVYEAEQVSLGRHVALKVLSHKAMADPKTHQRFQREAKAAAKLHHTNIVPVFGIGEHEGLPYYVMQFIRGLSLDLVLEELRRLKKCGANLGEVASLPMSSLAVPSVPAAGPSGSNQALRSDNTEDFQAAERNADNDDTSAVVPEEALSGSSAEGRLATAMRALAEDSISLPGHGADQGGAGRAAAGKGTTYWHSVARIGVQVANALEYAHRQGIIHRDIKPSNVLLDTKGTVWVTDFGLARADDEPGLTRLGDVLGTPRYMPPEAFEGRADARGDVYALGLTLYELLCLRPAFDERDRYKLLKQVTTTAPPRLDRLNREAPRDLVTIVHKAIDRDPARRYATAGLFAADLERFLHDEPIQARRISAVERFGRWCRHNPSVAGLLATVALLLVGVAAVATIAAVRIAVARDQATQHARDAVAAKENEAVQRKLAENSARESRRRLVRLHATEGERLLDEGDLLGALPWLTEALRLDHGDEGREQKHRIRIAGVFAQSPRLLQLWKHDYEALHAAFSGDGRQVVTTSHDRTARVWDAATGRAVGPALRHRHIVRWAAFSPDGRRLATASHDGAGRVWDIRTGKLVTPELTHKSSVEYVSFSPDGRWVVTASTDGTAQLWDAATGQPRTPPLAHASWLNWVSFSPDGRHVLTASQDHTAQVWDAATGRPIAPPLRHEGPVRSAAFSPDGRRVVTASEDRTARVWDTATSEPAGPVLEHRDIVLRAAFSPDGRFISTCSYDTTARVWHAATGAAAAPPMKHRNSVRTASFSPDGRYILTASYDHTARVWEAATGEPVTPPLRHSSLISSASFSPDGRRVVTASADWTVRMWDIVGRGPAPVALTHGREVHATAFSPDGRLLVTASADGTATVWSASTGQRVAGPWRHDGEVLHACFSPDGRRVLTACRDRTARVRDTVTGAELIPPLKHEGRVQHAVFSPDGNRVLTSSTDHTAQIWDANSGAAIGPRLEHRERVFIAVFSPDGRRVVTASADGTARVWDAATGAPVTAPLEHQGPVEEAAFSPDSRWVVTASADYTARVWDAETGRPLTEPLQHGAGVATASFSPDGSRIVTGSRRGVARLWIAATGVPAAPPLKHGMGQIRAVFSPDGSRVVTGGGDYAARVWHAATGEPLGPPLKHGGWVYHLTFSPDGNRLATACHDGTARIWHLPAPDPRPLDDLILFAQALSAQRVDAIDGPMAVEPDAQRHALETLRSNYPDHFSVSVSEALAWHQRQAELCLREKNGPAALFHLFRSRWNW